MLKNKVKENNRSYFADALIKGILVLLPITVIFIILGIIFDLIFDVVTPLGSLMDPRSDAPRWFFKLLALCILLVFILAVGMIVKNNKGRAHFRNFERNYLQRIPLYNAVLETVNQFSGIKEMPFKQVVLIDPYNNGVLMTGFITDQSNEKIYTVFVPTAPNPTNGFIFHVKKEQITFLDATPEQAMRTIVGMGTGTSKLFDTAKLKGALESDTSSTQTS